MSFLPPPAIRQLISVPTQDRVDFRAACFCHKKIVEVGFVCSVCLSSEHSAMGSADLSLCPFLSILPAGASMLDMQVSTCQFFPSFVIKSGLDRIMSGPRPLSSFLAPFIPRRSSVLTSSATPTGRNFLSRRCSVSMPPVRPLRHCPPPRPLAAPLHVHSRNATAL